VRQAPTFACPEDSLNGGKRVSEPKVLLLAGFPNSGTTVVSYMIGQHPSVFVAGELADFPAKQLKAGKICACGSPASKCVFWSAVMQRLRAAARRRSPPPLSQVYCAIAAESGAELIVDVAHDLHAVVDACSAEGIDLRLVHLRRQGLAVLNSRMRRVRGASVPSLLPRPQIARAWRHVIRWRRYNHALVRLRRRLGEHRAISLDYETVCARPASALAAVGRLTDLDFTDVGARLAAGVALNVMPHMIRGNPGLKAKRVVHLSRDDGFTKELTSSERLAYLAASGLAPLLGRRKWRAISSALARVAGKYRT
jgi:hypothetical protein